LRCTELKLTGCGRPVNRWIGESLCCWIEVTATVIGVIFHAEIIAQGGDRNGRRWSGESHKLISKSDRKHLVVTGGLASIHSPQIPLSQIASQLNQMAALNWIFIFIRPINTSHTNSPPWCRIINLLGRTKQRQTARRAD